jgi:hypothetical protein
MQHKLGVIQSLPPGQEVNVTFTEDELSSYFRFVIGPQMGIEQGKVRLVDEDSLVVAGEFSALGNRNVAATFDIQTTPGEPLELTGAAFQAFGSGQRRLGWVAIPQAFLEPYAEQINAFFGDSFQINSFVVIPDVSPEVPGIQPGLSIDGVTVQ